MQRIYLITLSKDTPSPLKPESDEAGLAKDVKKDEKKEDKKKEITVKVDVDGIADRVLQLPVAAANYRSLASVGSTLFYIRGTRGGGLPSFNLFDLSARKETGLGVVGGYEISADGKKMLVAKDTNYYIIDLPKNTIATGEALNLSGLQIQLDRHAEWRQIFQ